MDCNALELESLSMLQFETLSIGELTCGKVVSENLQTLAGGEALSIEIHTE